MVIPEEEIITKTVDFFVTENTLNPQATAEQIAAFLKKCKTTGKSTTVINQGGVRSIVVEERRRMTDAEGNDVRKRLGMDYEVPVDEDE